MSAESVLTPWMFDDIKGLWLIFRRDHGIVVIIFLRNILEIQLEIFVYEIYDIWDLLLKNSEMISGWE